MKHAIIILAHKDLENLPHLIEYFQHDCYIYIHIDKGAKISKELLDTIKSEPNVVFVSRKYRVHWGGMSMLKCEMYLLKEVYKRDDVDYIHLHSGQDYPIKPFEYWYLFFEEHIGLNFVYSHPMPAHYNLRENTFVRYIYYYPYDWYKNKKSAVKSVPKLISIQKRLHIKRHIPNQLGTIYCGSQWFSISREGLTTLMLYHKKYKAFYYRLYYTFAPEESYIQTILYNQLPIEKVFPRNYRYIRWQFENHNNPSNLGVEHFHLLVETDDLFARKMEKPYCDHLLSLVNRYLVHDIDMKFDAESGICIYDGYLKYKYDKNLANAIAGYCRCMGYKTIIDVGCGSGLLVAALRRRGLLATGFDANPYTPQLSANLLPDNDKPCFTCDILEDIIISEPFDVVTCINVMQYIPKVLLPKVIDKIISFSKYTIIIVIDNTISIHDKITIESILNSKMQQRYYYNASISFHMEEKAPISRNIKVYEKLIYN